MHIKDLYNIDVLKSAIINHYRLLYNKTAYVSNIRDVVETDKRLICLCDTYEKFLFFKVNKQTRDFFIFRDDYEKELRLQKLNKIL